MQCEHELKADGKFLVEFFSKRWLQDHVFETNSLAYKHLRNNVQVSPLYSTDILRNTSNTVPGEFSDNEDNTQTITNNDEGDNDYIMINIDNDSILEPSVANLNNKQCHL